MILDLILIFLIYGALILFGAYYVNLFFTQEEFTRSDFTNVTPFLKSVWENIRTRFSLLTFVLVALSSVVAGLLLPMVFKHWLINSALIFVVVYYILPFARGRYQRAQVSESDDYKDVAINIFVLYNNVIVVFFGTGFATALMYNWGTYKELHFFWFAINITAVTVLTGKRFRKSELFE